MARTKEFDFNASLDAAIRLFWEIGYEATSVRDLVKRMGISRQSLYDTYGDKRALFILALKRYHEQVVEQNLKVLRHTRPAIKGLRKFFEEKIRQALAPDEVRGCLMTNSAAEVTLLDRGMAQCVSDSLRAMEQAFFEAVKRAQQEGLVSRRKHPRALARFLLNSTQGLLVVSKTRSDAALLRDIVKTTLATLH